MGKILRALKRRARLLVQLGWAALSNGYVQGFLGGKIWRGGTKAFCVPGLNCYSCPGALGACPLGSLQVSLATHSGRGTAYVLGFLILVGALIGRGVCGWLCPFGLVQDLLHKIPFPKKLRKLPGDKVLKWLKYLLLAGFVVILPLFALDAFGQGTTWFCKYVCPSGTLLAGWPLAAANEGLRGALGWLFTWKSAILIVLILLSVLVYRPFCRYLCPLGALYGLFNPVSLVRIRVSEHKCISCGACQKACGLDIPVWKTPNSPECIRCGKCFAACPHAALSVSPGKKEIS